MRQPVLSACALLASFALGVGAAGWLWPSAPPGPNLIACSYAQDVADLSCQDIYVFVGGDGQLRLNSSKIGGLEELETLERRLQLIAARRRESAATEGAGRCRPSYEGVPFRPGVEVIASPALHNRELARVLRAAESAGLGPVSLTIEGDAFKFDSRF